MGTGTKNVKKENQSVSSSDMSDDSAMAVSSVLGEANGVLYGSPTAQTTPGIKTDFNEKLSSTPIASQLQEKSDTLANSVDSKPNSTYPPWAKDLVTAFGRLELKVNGMCKNLEKLENVEKKVENFSVVMSSLETELGNIKSGLNTSLQQTKDMVKTVSERTDGLEFQCGELDDRLKQLAYENQSLKMGITDLKARSMRDNLVFSNIPERPNEAPNVTEDILRDFLERELKMARTDVNNISFERVHRMAGRNNPRAIVAKFSSFKQRQDVKFKSRVRRGTNYFINEQFPPEVNEQRRRLNNIAKEKRRQGHQTRLTYNKLYIDGVLYKPPTFHRNQEQDR
jgi:hypothetical protein